MVEEALSCSTYAKREGCGVGIVEPGWYFGNDEGVYGCVELESTVPGTIGDKRKCVPVEWNPSATASV